MRNGIVLLSFINELREKALSVAQAVRQGAKKEGRWVYHRLMTHPDHLVNLFSLIAALPDPDGVYAVDFARFEQRLAHRQDGRCRVGVLTKTLLRCPILFGPELLRRSEP